MLLPLLLSHFSRVRLCATPKTAAHQAPPSLGFSRQEHWSGLPFPPPKYMYTCMLSLFSPVVPVDPGFSAHRLLQARITECVGKNPPVSAGAVEEAGSIPGSGRSSGEGNGSPLQCSCWVIPWTEEPGGLPFMKLQMVRHD